MHRISLLVFESLCSLVQARLARDSHFSSVRGASYYRHGSRLNRTPTIKTRPRTVVRTAVGYEVSVSINKVQTTPIRDPVVLARTMIGLIRKCI